MITLVNTVFVFADETVTYLSGTNPINNRTLTSGTYVLIDNTTFVDEENTVGANGLKIEENATVYIYIPQGLSLTATGNDGEGTIGGGAGIYLPSSSSLYLIGHGIVNATGGKAADGEVGESAVNTSWGAGEYDGYAYTNSGKGGNGGGGAGAGIGTNGGEGGIGGASVGRNSFVAVREVSHGKLGNNGDNGNQADVSGIVYKSGITLEANGGNAGNSPTVLSSNGSTAGKTWERTYFVGGSGGGGNGSGGRQGNNIGSGGSGGAGGGSGGSGGTTWSQTSNHYNPCGGHGGNADTNSGKTNGTSSGDANGGNGASGGITPDNNPARSAEDFSLTEDNIKTSISFDNQGGTGIDSKTLYMGYTGEGNDDGVTISPPTKNKHVFFGYYTEENGNGKLIYDSLGNLKNPDGNTSLDGKWVRVASDNQESLTLYAYWKPTYNINVTSDENGNISSSKTVAFSDDEILLTVTPDVGYILDYFEILSGDIEIINNSFIVKTSDIEIKAHFKEKTTFNITCTNSDTEISDISAKSINKSNVISMLNDYPSIIDHINNKTKDVTLFIEANETANKTIFIDKGIDENNGIFADVDLFVQADGEAKQKISDTHGYKVKIDLILTPEQANKIVDSNKQYYVLRSHDGVIEKITAKLTKSNNNFIMSFSSDKFSTFALCSENKPVSPSKSKYKPLNTGV